MAISSKFQFQARYCTLYISIFIRYGLYTSASDVFNPVHFIPRSEQSLLEVLSIEEMAAL